MTLTKHSLKILRYIYHRKSVSYSKLNMQFDDIDEILDSLVRSHYVIQIGGSTNQYGEPVPFREDTLFKLDELGIAEVESKQWFNLQFVLLQIVLPIVIAIITTLITISLPVLLSPSL